MRTPWSRRRNGVALALVAAVAISAGAIPSAFSAQQPPVRDGVLIKTHIRFGPNSVKGDVLRGSFIGDSTFCRGGRFRDRPVDDGIIKSFRCSDGRLKIHFEPRGNEGASTASGPWRIVGGTGRFQGMQGRGWMAVKFFVEADEGRETFTGTVTR